MLCCKKYFFRLIATVVIAIGAIACAKQEATLATNEQPATAARSAVAFDVYKSPTCGCCEDWIAHIEKSGITVVSHHPDDLNALKMQRGIAPQHQSCHTAISSDGYVFEGHVPAKFIHQFLAQKPPHALGLAVPAMPVGSPGMEMEDRFVPYQVLLLKTDGGSEVYADIRRAEDQY